MKPAVYATYAVTVEAGKHKFKASSSEVKFDGFLSVYTTDEEKEVQIPKLADLKKGATLPFVEFDSKQHFTQPPAHYTEALLVKSMEEQGIGRPSTYAPTITTLLTRRYITKEQKNLYVTQLGEAVNRIMETAFPVIVDMNFTANLESLFDKIEEGVINWKVVIRNFYPDLAEAVKNASEVLENVEIAEEESDEECELCGRRMVIKYGPHGKFLACPGFPECRNTKPYYEKTGIACPECGSDVVIKLSRKGRRYYGCINNPECSFMSWDKPSTVKCPECGGYMVEKGNRLLCKNEACGFVTQKPKEAEQ
jgi:DNA topoisomerase-1